VSLLVQCTSNVRVSSDSFNMLKELHNIRYLGIGFSVCPVGQSAGLWAIAPRDTPATLVGVP
jgi:hypothetical protein